VALSVCLLLDDVSDRAVRRLWGRLEDAGVPTLLSHTHGRHLPHLTLASLTSYDLPAVRTALTALPAAEPLDIRFEALGMFRRSRCWLAPTVTTGLLVRQEAAVRAVRDAGAEVHHAYRPGEWLPHLTLAPRLHLRELAVVAEKVNEILPLPATFDRAALVQTSTGEVETLTHLV
jgi:2'-5' RNA ligase